MLTYLPYAPGTIRIDVPRNTIADKEQIDIMQSRLIILINLILGCKLSE